MVRTVDYDSRRKAVLASTIDRYISQVEPISSEEIAREFNLSSATIRNIFKELEDSGYLTHPYTSAGRVPTVKGYRYYVDFLMGDSELLPEEKKQITLQYKEAIKKGDDMAEKSSEVLSVITHYAGLAAEEDEGRLFYKGISFMLEQPEFSNVEHMRLLIKMLEDKAQILQIINRDFTDKVKIYIGDELGCSQMQGCSLAVSRYAASNKHSGRIAVLGPLRMAYSHIKPTLEYVSDILVNIFEEV